MKRLLIFAILFGGGLFLLVTLSRLQREAKKERLDAEQEQMIREGREENLPFTRIPVQPEEETARETPTPGTDQGSGISGTIAGEVTIATDREDARYDLHIDDVKHRGEDYYDVKGVTLDVYDPATGVLDKTFVSTSGVFLLEWNQGILAIGETERIQLVDVVVTLHEGSPMAPLTLTLPSAELDMKTGSLYSDQIVDLVGDGITGRGLGLELLEKGRKLTLLKHGVLNLRAGLRDKGASSQEEQEQEQETTIELRARGNGPIILQRKEIRENVEHITIGLPKGGQLVTQDEIPLTVKAGELSLDGRVLSVEEKTAESTKIKRIFRAEHAELIGDASFEREGHRVTGGRAEVFFDASGDVRELIMSDQPIAIGMLELVPDPPQEDALPEPPQDPKLVEVEVSGVGPMVLNYSSDRPVADMDLPGPSQVKIEELDFVITAEERISGNVWGRGLAGLTLHGAVTGRFEELIFKGANVTLRGARSEGRGQQLMLDTKRPASLTGPDSRGNLFELHSGSDLKLALEKGEVELRFAKDVRLEIAGEDGWNATMGEVRDLNLETGVFEASHGVVYNGSMGTGTALRASGHSKQHIELFGEGQVPATYNLDADKSDEFDLGLVRAMHIDLRPEEAFAKQDVEIRFTGRATDGGTLLRQEVDCESFSLLPLAEEVEGQPTPFEFEATGVTRALLLWENSESTLSAQHLTGRGTYTRAKGMKTVFELGDVEASGAVKVKYDGEAGHFTARGARVTWKQGGHGRLEAAPGDRVEARGRFQEQGLPYVLTATWIEYGDDELQALFPEISLDRPAALPQILIGRSTAELYSGSAEWMTSDAAGLLLAGNAHFAGKTMDGGDLTLDAGSMHLLRSPEGNKLAQGISELVAWDGFKLQVEDGITGTGEILQIGYRLLRLEGRPARLDARGFIWESTNIEYDVPKVLVTTDQGRMYGAPGSGTSGWVATYESLQPFETEDSMMMVMSNLSIKNGEREIRAKWATFWLDRDEWLEKTQDWLSGSSTPDEAVPPSPPEVQDPTEARGPTLFGRFNSKQISKVLKEIYLEGDVEYLNEGDRVAHMAAAYVDMVDGHGWIQDAELYMGIKVGRVTADLVVRADWLRHSSDGSLSADYAEVTACGFAEPHYFVRTRNLRMSPVADRSSVWDISLKKNSLKFDNGLSIPLPGVSYKSDGKGRPTFSGLGFGDSARYGTFVEASLDVDVSKGMTKAAAILNAEPDEIDSRYKIKASIYGSRGLLLDQQFRLTAADHFWMDVYLDGLYDTGEDRGLLRYKTPGKDGFRWILGTQSRYGLADEEWFDFAFQTQSDAGVQAEFTERQFIRYERRDTYLRWRKAQEQHYYSAKASVRVDDFRDEVERLPDLGYLRSLTPVGELWGQSLLYSASADAAYLRLRPGEGTVISPFDPDFASSVDREFLRADTRHRVETPFDANVLGIRVSPYVEVIGTAWSEGVYPDTSPSRGAAIAGLEAQTTFYKTLKHGVVNSITPLVGVHADLASFEDGGIPIQVDEIDESLEGQFLDFGLRSRWRRPGGARYLDTSVRASHGADVGAGQEEGWRPLRVLGKLLAVYRGIPYAITHDGKYDLDDGDTTHSFTSLSFLPIHDLGVEVGYNRGLDQKRDVLFDAVSLGFRYEATVKWSFEARQSVSSLDDQALSSDVMLRRTGHDFIFELGYGFRAGEGGNTITFKYRPLLGWRDPSFGMMRALQNARL